MKDSMVSTTLIPLGETAVRVSSEEDFLSLTRIYESGGWTFFDTAGNLSPVHPHHRNSFKNAYKKNNDLLIEVGASARYFEIPLAFRLDEYGEKRVISLQEFYKEQGITKEQIDKIRRQSR